MENGTKLLAGCSLSLFGFGVMTHAIQLLRTELTRRGTWDQVETVVTEVGKGLETDSNGNPYPCYYPIFRYRYGDRDFAGRGRTRFREPHFSVGTRILIAVNPQNPAQSDVVADQRPLGIAWGFLFVGVTCAAIGTTLAGMAFLSLIGVTS
jgi:hypothetical protein